MSDSLPTSDAPVPPSNISTPTEEEEEVVEEVVSAPPNGFGSLWASTVKLANAVTERTQDIDQNLGISRTVIGVSKNIDEKFKVQENAANIGAAINHSAQNFDNTFQVMEKSKHIGSAVGNTVTDLDEKLHVTATTKSIIDSTGQKLQDFESNTKILEKSSNALAKSADWATDQIKMKPADADEDW